MRHTIASLMILLGVLLSPAAVALGWARAHLTDADGFVAEFGPIASEAALQDAVTGLVVDGVTQSVDLSTIAQSGADAVGLDEDSWLGQVIGDAAGRVQEQLTAALEETVAQYVASDRFAGAWRSALRASHAQAVATLTDADGAAATVDADGVVTLNLQPVVAGVKQALVDRGLTFVSSIAEPEVQVQLATVSQAPAWKAWYRVIVDVGGWLWAAAALLLVGGVAVARRRLWAGWWASAGVGVAMLALVAVAAWGRAVFLGGRMGEALGKALSTSVYSHLAWAPVATAWTVIGVAAAACVACSVALAIRARRTTPSA